MQRIQISIQAENELMALAERMGKHAKEGDSFLLVGDLGAGKTTFSKAFAKGLGVEEEITSPTFSILNAYDSGREVLHHFDLYRLNEVEELNDIGFYEYVAEGVSLVEWANLFEEEMPESALRIEIVITGETARNLVLSSDICTEEELRSWVHDTSY